MNRDFLQCRKYKNSSDTFHTTSNRSKINHKAICLEAEMAIVSSRGQLVIPKGIRKRMKITKGNIFAISSHGKTLVMKKMENPISRDDLNTLKEVEEAWESIEKGEGITQTKDEFLKELKAWSES